MAPRAPEGQQVDIGEANYLARRSTVNRIKGDILGLLAAGPVTANGIKYRVSGGGREIRAAREELRAEGRIVNVPGRSGRDQWVLVSALGAPGSGGS